MKIFTFCSFKGGTGKTSTALHIGAAIAKFHNKKIILIDFDSQANLSIGLGVGPDNLSTMVPVLESKSSLSDVIQKTQIDGLSLVAANAYLDGIEKNSCLNQDPYAHERLRRILDEIKDDYDFCFIDTPPSLGWLTQSAFFAAQYSVICAIPEAYSILALKRLKDFHNIINQYHPIEMFGVCLSLWDERGAINNDLIKEINTSFNNSTFSSKIRRDITVSRAAGKGITVFDFDKESRAAIDYKALADEFLNKLKKDPTHAK